MNIKGMKLDDVRKIVIKSVKSENEVSGASNSSQGQKSLNGNPTQFYERQKLYPRLCVYNLIRAKM
jgi:hypothetical protein